MFSFPSPFFSGQAVPVPGLLFLILERSALWRSTKAGVTRKVFPQAHFALIFTSVAWPIYLDTSAAFALEHLGRVRVTTFLEDTKTFSDIVIASNLTLNRI
ncbi:MAG: hypothetical protein CL941_03730 [Desulfobacter sp.]|nr:hypothetical protein [Desulfobacter sp.]